VDNGDDYRETSYDDGPVAEVRNRAVAELAAFRPDVLIIDALKDAVLDEVIGPLESRLARTGQAPIYIAVGTLEGAGLARLLQAHRSVTSRLLGMAPPARSPSNMAFVRSYNAAFGESLSPEAAPAAPYDSFYLLAYAAYAAGAGQPTGADIARAIARLVPPGKAVEVGPTHLLEAFGELNSGASIDLRGAFARMDFDLQSGESPVDYAILCATYQPATHSVAAVESGLVYDGSRDKLEGTFACALRP
jgi:hypothetical protein